MKVEIKVPPMGESITEATVGEILKASGSHVKMDEEVLELETDKVNQVLYAPAAGVLNFTVKQDDVVKIGDVIGAVDSEGKVEEAPEEKNEEKVEPAPEPVKEVKAEVTGEARISKESYLKEMLTEKEAPVAKPQQTAPAPVSDGRETRKRMTKLRKVIGQRLVEAQQTTAMLTTFNEVDMTEVMAIRKKYKESFLKEHGVKLGFMSFFVKAVEIALKEFPDFNSYIDGEEIVHREYFDIGIAVGTDKGLFVPVIRDCDQLGFAEIESEIARYAVKAREGNLAVDDLQGGGFTITNGGTFGSLLSTPILNPPQSGILGMHKIEKRPVVVDDQIVIRPMMYLALSYDHRIIDGKGAVSFLVQIKNSLEDPSRMLLGV